MAQPSPLDGSRVAPERDTHRALLLLVTGGYALVLIISLVVSSRVMGGLERLAQHADDLLQHPVIVSNAAIDAMAQTALIREHMMDLAGTESAARMAQLERDIADYDARLERDLLLAEQSFLGDMSRVRDARARTAQWRELRVRIIALQRGNAPIAARALVRSDGQALFERIQGDLGYIADFARHKAEEFRNESREDAARVHAQVRELLIASSLLTALLGIGTLSWMRRMLRLQHAHAGRDRVMASILDTTLDGVVTIDQLGIIRTCNKAAERLFGYRADELLGRNVEILMPGPASGRHDAYIAAYLASGKARIIGSSRELVGARKDGTTFPIELAVTETLIDGKRYFAGIVRDITERRRAEEEIRRLAHYDQLTNLVNRRLFNDRLQQTLRAAHRSPLLFALLFIDINRFKEINDDLGHEAGDAVLCEVARRIQDCVREVDTVSRWGGDEFIVLLSTLSEPADAERIADKIRAAMGAPFAFRGRAIDITLSMGSAHYPAHGTDEISLLRAADESMYQTKRAARVR